VVAGSGAPTTIRPDTGGGSSPRPLRVAVGVALGLPVIAAVGLGGTIAALTALNATGWALP
jgi:hypothetical protein